MNRPSTHRGFRSIREKTGRAGTGASNRVNRGGSWNNNARNLRSANRNRNTPGNRNDNLGFRPASSSPRPIVVVERLAAAMAAQCM